MLLVSPPETCTCRARVATSVTLRDLNLDVPATEGQRIEVAANGLPLWQGAQIAVDTTLVCPVRRDGQARPGADARPGLALEQGPSVKCERSRSFSRADGAAAASSVLLLMLLQQRDAGIHSPPRAGPQPHAGIGAPPRPALLHFIRANMQDCKSNQTNKTRKHQYITESCETTKVHGVLSFTQPFICHTPYRQGNTLTNVTSREQQLCGTLVTCL